MSCVLCALFPQSQHSGAVKRLMLSQLKVEEGKEYGMWIGKDIEKKIECFKE